MPRLLQSGKPQFRDYNDQRSEYVVVTIEDAPQREATSTGALCEDFQPYRSNNYIVEEGVASTFELATSQDEPGAPTDHHILAHVA